MRADKWSNIIGYLIVVCAILAGFGYLDARRADAQDAGRSILCEGIIANTGNVARDNPNVVRLCKEVGVDRADYPPTIGG